MPHVSIFTYNQSLFYPELGYYIKDSLSISGKKRRASEIMEVLTKQLSQGWNPWVTDDESRGFVYFDICLDRYLDYVDCMDRKKTGQ